MSENSTAPDWQLWWHTTKPYCSSRTQRLHTRESKENRKRESAHSHTHKYEQRAHTQTEAHTNNNLTSPQKKTNKRYRKIKRVNLDNKTICLAAPEQKVSTMTTSSSQSSPQLCNKQNIYTYCVTTFFFF